MIGKRTGNKNNGTDNSDISGPPPEQAETKKPRKSRKSGASSDSKAQAEIDLLNSKLAASAAQIELYQFQIKNLRADLDHIKLHSVLTNLGGPVVISEKRPETSHEPHPSPVETATEQLPVEIKQPEQAEPQDNIKPEEPETAAEPDNAPLTQEEGAESREETVTPAAADEDACADTTQDGPQLNIKGIEQNFAACIETIKALCNKIDENAATIKNRETLIDLQRERIELEKEKTETEFVPLSQYEALQAQNEELNVRISSIEGEPRERREEDDEVSPPLQQLERLETKVQEVSDSNGALQTEIENLNCEKEALREINETLKNENSAQQVEIEAIQLEKNGIQAEKDAIQAKFDEEQAARAAEIEKYKARIQTLNEERTKSESEILARLESENEALVNESETLRKELEALRGEIESLRSREEAGRDECGKLRAEIESLRDENQAYANDIAAMDGELAELKKQGETLKNEKEALSLGLVEIRKGRDAEIDSLMRNIETLKAEQAAAFEESANELTYQNRELREQKDELEKRLEETSACSEEEIERLKRVVEELRIEKENGEKQAEERMKFHAERLEGEFAEMREAMQARENELARQEKQINELEGEIASLNKENFNIRSMLEATRAKVVEVSEKDAGGEKKRLLERFSSKKEPDVLLELRALFISTRKYDDAVRTFRKLLIEPGNQKFMPAVCLLVGEFYNLAGRKEEGAFYLANPLIKDDVFARQIIANIQSGDAGIE